MDQHLNTDRLNTVFSREAIAKAFAQTAMVHEYDKMQPSRTYDCIVVLKISHLKRYGNRAIPLQYYNGRLVPDYCITRIRNLDSIPEDMWQSALNSNYGYVHVFVKRKLYHYNDKQVQELKILLDPAKQTMGYFSNRVTLSKRGIAFFENRRSIPFSMVFEKIHEVRAQCARTMKRLYAHSA
jgi:hypothetical protein